MSIVDINNLTEGTITSDPDGRYLIGDLSPNSFNEVHSVLSYVDKHQLMGRFIGVNTAIEVCGRQNFGYRTSHNSSRKTGTDKNWVRYSTYKKYLETAIKNPSEFVDFSEADLQLNTSENAGNNVSFEVQGDYLDIGRLMSGEPEVFGVMEGGRITQDFCSIVICGNAFCGIKQSVLTEKSRRICRLVDMLENANVRCRVIVVFSNDNNHMEVVVKDYQDNLIITDVAIATSPDFFRRTNFSFLERSKTVRSGYGRTYQLTPKIARAIDTEATKIIAIGKLDSNDTDLVNKRFDKLEKEIQHTNFAKEEYNCHFE